MAYCTLSDIIKLVQESSILQLTDDENTGSVNQARVDEAIAQADSEIDSYCGMYTLPFSFVPSLIRKLSVDMAIYHLYSRASSEEMPPVRKERYEQALSYLRDIAKGVVTLGVEEEIADGTILTNKTTRNRVFTRRKMRYF